MSERPAGHAIKNGYSGVVPSYAEDVGRCIGIEHLTKFAKGRKRYPLYPQKQTSQKREGHDLVAPLPGF